MTVEGTGDDPVTCGLCGHQTSVAMIVKHLVSEHGYDQDELEQAIQDAPIIIELDDEDHER